MLKGDILDIELLKWMEEFVEKPNPLLGNWMPCPFARKARLANKIAIVEGQDAYSDSLSDLDWNKKDVYVFWYPTEKYTGKEITDLTEKLNQKLMPKNIVVLDDHPNNVETINGVCMNFGQATLLIVQKLDELNSASEQLKEKGYYDKWSTHNLAEVVDWRYKYHNVR